MKEYTLQNFESDDALAAQILNDHPCYAVAFDGSLTLPSEELNLIEDGSKTTSIKFKPGTIRLPRKTLDVIEKETGRKVGHVSYDKIAILFNSSLTDDYAVGDGFKGLKDFNEALTKRYGHVPDDALLCIHYFSKFESSK